MPIFYLDSGSIDTLEVSSSLLVSGSLIITGSVESESGFTGSLFGTASYSLTASYVEGGGGGGNSTPITATGISIADPTSAEDITLLYTSGSVVIQGVEGVVRGAATPSVTVTLRYDTDRSATGTAIVSAQSVTSTTTGDLLTLTGDTTVPAGNFVWLETTATGGTVDELFIGLIY